MYLDTPSPPNLVVYASLLLSALSLAGNVVQYLAGKRARDAQVHKTESERKSVDVSTLNTLLKTVNEQVTQVVEMRRRYEDEHLKDHEELAELRMGLGECQSAHEESERERARLGRELNETKGQLQATTERLNQLEDIIKTMNPKESECLTTEGRD